MKTAYIVSGDLIDEETIKLSEPILIEKGKLKIIIEFESEEKKIIRHFGMMKGKITINPGFYDSDEDFKEYM